MPIRTDVTLWRGNNAPEIAWTLAEAPPDGAAFFLAVEAGGRTLFTRDTPSGSLLLAGSTLSWSPSLAESRAIPPGRVARYEIEQRVGDVETTLFFGDVTGLGGVNADAGAPAGATMLDAADPENIPLFLLGWLA